MKKFLLLLLWAFLAGLATQAAAENVITFTTSKAIGESIKMKLIYTGAVTITGVSGTASSSTEISYALTSQTVTVNGDVTEFTCNDQSLTKLDVTGNTLLTAINCTNNDLTELDVTGNTLLTAINCTNNDLTELDVSKNTLLYSLRCENQKNKLAKLTIGEKDRLHDVFCENNKLASLDMTKAPSLEYFQCYNNNLTNLKITGVTKLYSLVCYNNQLTELNLSTNTDLYFIDCHSNKLTSLDVSNNKKMYTLDCSMNQLTKLDLSKNSALGQFACYDNKLTELDLSTNTNLIALYCQNNHLRTLNLEKNTKLYNNYSLLSPQTLDVVPELADDYLGILMPNDANKTFTNIVTGGSAYTPAVAEDVLVETGGNKYLNIAELKSDLHYGADTKVTYTYGTGNTGTNTGTKTKQMNVTLTFQNAHVQKVTAAEQGTLYLDYPAEVPEGTSVHYCTESNIDRVNQKMLTTKMGDAGTVVPANTGFLTVATAGYYLFNRSDKTPGIATGNIMQGTTNEDGQNVTRHSVLTLGKGNSTGQYGFWLYTGSKVPTWRAYIPASYIGNATNAKGFELIYDDGETTGISRTEVTDTRDGVVYDLAGRKVAKSGIWAKGMNRLPKGIYIMGGKKIVNK